MLRSVGSANPPCLSQKAEDEGATRPRCSPASVGASWPMKVTRRSFLVTAAAAVAAAPAFPRRDRQSRATRLPILGEGEHQVRSHSRLGRVAANHSSYGNTHGVCEDSQGHIYVHHTVQCLQREYWTLWWSSIRRANLFAPGAEQFKGGAHGLTIRKEGSEEFLYLCDYPARHRDQADVEGRRSIYAGVSGGIGCLQGEEHDGSAIAYRPTNVAIRSQRRYLCWRWIRIKLHQSIQPESRIHSHLRRTRQRRRPDRLSARAVGRHAFGDAGAGGDRSRQ